MNFVINDRQWELKTVPPTHPTLTRSDGTRTVGVTDNADMTIYVAYPLSPWFLLKVITHEICHAAMFSYDVDLTLEQEELVADLIATYGREIVETADMLFSGLSRVSA